MQSTSETWQALAATGDFMIETVAVIGGVDYAAISAPEIDRSLMQSGLSVGNVCSASMRVNLLTDDAIERGAAVTIKTRLTDGETTSEWLPQGTFYISKRVRDPVTGLLALECYDAMLKANAAYQQSGSYPKAMSAVVGEIAAQMGVSIDARTSILTGDDYMVPLPEMDASMHDVLAGIAGVHGGNWIITPEGKLRLVTLNETGATVDIIGITGSVKVCKPQTVTGIRVRGDDGTEMVGGNTGLSVDITSPYATNGNIERVKSWLFGMTYQAYALEGAIYDPAAELGDRLSSREDITSVLASERLTYSVAFRASVSAPEAAEIEDEYPYIGATAEIQQQIRRLNKIAADSVTADELAALNARIDHLTVDDLTAGIIKSADFSIVVIPYVYPKSGLYPANNTYASNGEQIVSGFAIDFATKQIYGMVQ